MNYNAPGGKVSALLSKLFGQEPGQVIEGDLRRLKQILETGGVATIEGQPSARDTVEHGKNNESQNQQSASMKPVSEVEQSQAASAGRP